MYSQTEEYFDLFNFNIELQRRFYNNWDVESYFKENYQWNKITIKKCLHIITCFATYFLTLNPSDLKNFIVNKFNAKTWESESCLKSNGASYTSAVCISKFLSKVYKIQQ